MSSTHMLTRRIDALLAISKTRLTSITTNQNVFIYRKDDAGQVVLSPADQARYKRSRGACVLLPEKDRMI
jgi:hypothetical protein